MKFEEALQALEKLVGEMESGNVALDELMKKYQEGTRLLKFCRHELSSFEHKIEVLMKDDGQNGEWVQANEDDQSDDGQNNSPRRVRNVGAKNPIPSVAEEEAAQTGELPF